MTPMAHVAAVLGVVAAASTLRVAVRAAAVLSVVEAARVGVPMALGAPRAAGAGAPPAIASSSAPGSQELYCD
jgi:hypothetical protein